MRQKGYIYTAGGAWHVMYRERVLQPDGIFVALRRSRKLAPLAECATRTEARRLADELLARVDSSFADPRGTMTITQFAEKVWLPCVERDKRPSTIKGYRQIWNAYLVQRVSKFRVRDFRTPDAVRLLQSIAAAHELSKQTLTHIKFVMSALFGYACLLGIIPNINPMDRVPIPARAREACETYAYTLDEIKAMLMILPEPARSAVAIAGFAGLRKGEIRACLWDNYDGEILWVTQSAWGSQITAPKSRASKAPVPVISQLAAILDQRRRTSGLMFPSHYAGRPLSFDRLAADVIRPALTAAGLEWHGFHAFRRGLATNLYEMDLPSKMIQAILRHSNVATTERIYVKTRQKKTAQRMRETMQQAFEPHAEQD